MFLNNFIATLGNYYYSWEAGGKGKDACTLVGDLKVKVKRVESSPSISKETKIYNIKVTKTDHTNLI